MKLPTCPWCASPYCDPTSAFHDFLRRHDLHPECISDVGDGWLPLLDTLVSDLRALGWQGKVGQIKEKFGGLRFYAEGTNGKMRDRILLAEQQSTKICDTCGQPGQIVRDGRMATRCTAHELEK